MHFKIVFTSFQLTNHSYFVNCICGDLIQAFIFLFLLFLHLGNTLVVIWEDWSQSLPGHRLLDIHELKGVLNF